MAPSKSPCTAAETEGHRKSGPSGTGADCPPARGGRNGGAAAESERPEFEMIISRRIARLLQPRTGKCRKVSQRSGVPLTEIGRPDHNCLAGAPKCIMSNSRRRERHNPTRAQQFSRFQFARCGETRSQSLTHLVLAYRPAPDGPSFCPPPTYPKPQTLLVGLRSILGGQGVGCWRLDLPVVLAIGSPQQPVLAAVKLCNTPAIPLRPFAPSTPAIDSHMAQGCPAGPIRRRHRLRKTMRKAALFRPAKLAIAVLAAQTGRSAR